MRKLAVAVLLVLALPALSRAAAVTGELVTCSYRSFGTFGQLTITAEPGRQFAAVDSCGVVVAAGMSCGGETVVPVVGAAEGPLRVHVEGGVLLLVDRDTMWD